MYPEQVIFYVFAALVLISGSLVVTMKNLVRSVFLFFVTLFAVAGLYVLSMGDFIAVTQVIVYIGGVLVLMLFAFMLSSKEYLNAYEPVKVKHHFTDKLPAVIIVAVLLFILLFILVKSNMDNLDWQTGNGVIKPSDNTVHMIGINIMTSYLLPFEIASVFLMMALIGAAHLARKERNL